MHILGALISLLLLAACESGSTQKPESSSDEQTKKTVVFKVPDDAIALLWQRSFPEEHRKLVERARDHDPFGNASGIPEDQLTPSTFGLVGWQRGLIPEVFNQLGHPLQDGAKAALDARGILEVTHSITALNALKARFPEILQIQAEQDVHGNTH
jgi:hypothetical protein